MLDTENASERHKQLGWFLGNLKPSKSKIRLHLIERNRSKWGVGVMACIGLTTDGMNMVTNVIAQ